MDALGYGPMATRMGRWVGDHSKPPIALTLKQVLWELQHLERTWVACKTIGAYQETAAAVTHLLGWLVWLRSAKLFSLKREDMTVT